MLKVELHSHSADDPVDAIPHTTLELIDRAALLGYNALAVTLHERQLDIEPFRAYAADRGVTLIPGIEQTIEGKHVLLLNFSRHTEDVETFDALASLRRREPGGLVIAPHPFFPGSTCLRGFLPRHASLFDAVECNAMFTASLDFNGAARRRAQALGKPMVGNGDVHRLRQLGTTYSLVDATPTADAICAAVRAGNVQVVSRPLSWPAATGIMAEMFAADLTARWFPGPTIASERWPGGATSAARPR